MALLVQERSHANTQDAGPERGRSVLAGLIGAGIQRSLTPAMHEREGDAQGLRVLYQKIDLTPLGLGVEALPELLTAAERMGFAGLNITYPAKQAVIPHLDELSDDARALGAVNTVVLREGRRIGHNTDWWGFAEGFRRGLPGAQMTRVVQLGAGGAGAAVAHALLTLGTAELILSDVEPSRAQDLAASLCERFGAGRARAAGDLQADLASATGLTHCTPTGMDKLPGLPLPAEWLQSGLWVAEIVYFPLETELLRRARALGCRTLDGGGMAVFQAVEAFRLFTGLDPDAERMRRHFTEMTSAS
ncbi:shikimate dehydrogenase [Aureimonas ureilytica]|uniref:shikimate dehydrogenase n=1 Tax=Aureimonas ureilytica TaxID=401562 RepID=UPI0009EAFBD1|nr:shikimate dehydrogenase [Aureimonas ureilytica]